MNYTEINLDLQSTVKRIYQNIVYRSSFYKMLNDSYIGELRNAGTPMIEVLKSQDVTINTRETKEITNQLTPSLMAYDSVKVDLTELPMDYSIRIPILVTGSGIANALDSAIQKKDSAVAKAIDTYGFGKLASNEDIVEKVWNPSTKEEYIETLTGLSADMFNNDIYDTYRLALNATEYGKYVAALTSVLKYETMAGVEGVDRGTIARAYGVDTFQVNDTVLGDVKGYFFNPMAIVGDAFFDAFVQHVSPQGWPGYFVFEGNILFGAEVVESKAIYRLVEEVSA
ncbi:MAG: hypothetical protein IKE89_03395 [Bacilli bacterium]|nr:hypothetical protein [Bacilli bacterium]